MGCFGTKKLLLRYFRGELDEQRVSQVREHLTRCARCRARLDKMKQLGELLQNSSTLFPVQEPNPALWDKLEAAIQSESTPIKQLPWWQSPRNLRLASLTACGVILAVFVAGQLQFRQQSQPADLGKSAKAVIHHICPIPSQQAELSIPKQISPKESFLKKKNGVAQPVESNFQAPRVLNKVAKALTAQEALNPRKTMLSKSQEQPVEEAAPIKTATQSVHPDKAGNSKIWTHFNPSGSNSAQVPGEYRHPKSLGSNSLLDSMDNTASLPNKNTLALDAKTLQDIKSEYGNPSASGTALQSEYGRTNNESSAIGNKPKEYSKTDNTLTAKAPGSGDYPTKRSFLSSTANTFPNSKYVSIPGMGNSAPVLLDQNTVRSRKNSINHRIDNIRFQMERNRIPHGQPINIELCIKNEAHTSVIIPEILVIGVQAQGDFGPLRTVRIPFNRAATLKARTGDSAGVQRQTNSNSNSDNSYRILQPSSTRDYTLNLRKAFPSPWTPGKYSVMIHALGSDGQSIPGGTLEFVLE